MFKVEGQDRCRGGRTGAIDLLYQRTTADEKSVGGGQARIKIPEILLLIVDVQRIDLAAHHAGVDCRAWREKQARRSWIMRR